MHSPVLCEKLPRNVGKTAISCHTNAFDKRIINSWITWKMYTSFTIEHVCSFIHSFAIRISYLIMYVISWTTPFVSFFSNMILDSIYCQVLLYTNGRTEQLMNSSMFTKRRENYLRHHVYRNIPIWATRLVNIVYHTGQFHTIYSVSQVQAQPMMWHFNCALLWIWDYQSAFDILVNWKLRKLTWLVSRKTSLYYWYRHHTKSIQWYNEYYEHP